MDSPKRYPMREWTFRVEGVTAPGEIMCIVGSCDELGDWNPKRVIPMSMLDGAADTTSYSSPGSVNANAKSHLLVPYENADNFSSICETKNHSS